MRSSDTHQGLDWLTSRPIAHRGYHNPSEGRMENGVKAIAAAVENNFSIELDVQLTSDREALVFHDETLDRLTHETGPVLARSSADIKTLPFCETDDRIATLGEILDLVNGRVPVIVELKSHWDKSDFLVRRTIEIARAYKGPIAIMSFDPFMVAGLRTLAPNIPRGIVAERRFTEQGQTVTPFQAFYLGNLCHWLQTRPDFISYAINDLPAPVPSAIRRWTRIPLICWTVRTAEQRRKAAIECDQITFEGFHPDRD
ncbi:glycerophosphodiester phosphodiesterase family protein [Coralliovum pocilloporae]|uniref:glycerophosphodiester phosphodiesterase family protein n=1 Tax=Coralliovum pocilloporae TaxID=3066369 RepID=UPI00330745E6